MFICETRSHENKSIIVKKHVDYIKDNLHIYLIEIIALVGAHQIGYYGFMDIQQYYSLIDTFVIVTSLILLIIDFACMKCLIPRKLQLPYQLLDNLKYKNIILLFIYGLFTIKNILIYISIVVLFRDFYKC